MIPEYAKQEVQSFSFNGMAVPEHTMGSLLHYIYEGRPTGGFLKAVINNDLKAACAKADKDNMANLPAIIAYLYNYAPSECWGFYDAYDDWIQRHETPARMG